MLSSSFRFPSQSSDFLRKVRCVDFVGVGKLFLTYFRFTEADDRLLIQSSVLVMLDFGWTDNIEGERNLLVT